MPNILEIKNLNYKYGSNTIFNNFNLTIPEGKSVSIAGPNSSGKTTLIKLIAGLLPSKESITIGYSYVDDKRIHDHSREIGIVFGNQLNTFLFENTYKEMAFPLENLAIDPNEIEKKVINMAKLFQVSYLLDKKTSDLTNSEKQIVFLMIALLHNPKLLLLDNPFSMLNKATKKKVMSILKEYQIKNKLTIILATTNLDDTLDSDYLYIINNGEIVVEGKPLDVFKEDTVLNRVGLQLPFMVDLSLKLEFYELLNNVELDLDRMVNTLWK